MSRAAKKRKIVVRYYSPAEIAQSVGKSTETIRGWLSEAGCLIKRRGYYYTTAELALVHFPEWSSVLAR